MPVLVDPGRKAYWEGLAISNSVPLESDPGALVGASCRPQP